MNDPAQIEAGFAQIRAERALRSRIDEVRSADFWRALNPQLTVSDRPFSTAQLPVPVAPAMVNRVKRQLLEEGYAQTPPLVEAERLARLRTGVENVVAAGFPSGLACVYDEFYQAFDGLQQLFVPILGDDYQLVLQGLWAFLVAPGDPVYGLWTALRPHRDELGPDPAVLSRQMPSILTVWIPLTDVLTLDSCLYIVPSPGDADYYSHRRDVRTDAFRLQDVRALPCAAGSVLSWSSHMIHWGSRSSALAAGPCIALTAYLARRDGPVTHPFTIGFDDEAPFLQRLAWIEDCMGMPGLLG